MKVGILTDTHFGARNDSQQFDSYFERFYTDVFFPYIDKHNIKTVFHLGDVFDRRKYINFQILRSCKNYFFQPLLEREIDMYVIPGNHDTYYKNTNEINSLDLLLREYNNIHIIQNLSEMQFGKHKFIFVPWLCAENFDESMKYIKRHNDICVGHFEISGFDMFKGAKNDTGIKDSVFAQYETVLTGHFHHRSAKNNIYYLGSPYEFTWSDYDDPRGFHIFDCNTTEIEFIQNPYKIFHKIYYDDKKEMNLDASQYKKSCVKVIVTNKTDYHKFDKFIEALYNNEVIELTIHEDFSEFETEAMDDSVNIEDTMTLLSEFIDSRETSDDKEKLKTLLKTLYVEAQNLET